MRGLNPHFRKIVSLEEEYQLPTKPIDTESSERIYKHYLTTTTRITTKTNTAENHAKNFKPKSRSKTKIDLAYTPAQ